MRFFQNLIYFLNKKFRKESDIKMEIFETSNPKQEKVKKMSWKKYNKEKEKEMRKYMNGQNPDEIEWNDVEIYQDKENDAYLIIYNSNIVQLTGVIKF